MAALDPLPRVSLDESGNTGEALLDPDQPIYVLASTSMSSQAAADLITSIGWPLDRELKYRKLQESSEGRRVVVELLRRLDRSTARAAIAHKRFMLMAKLVDNLVEPLAAETDFNLYEDGAHVALTELWHAVMPALIGLDGYLELLSRFVTMSRSPSIQTTNSFYNYVDRLIETVSDARMVADLEFISVTRSVFGASYPDNPDSLDPAIPFLFATADAWGKTLGLPYAIDHDHAKVIRDCLPSLAPFFFSSAPHQVIGQGDRAFTVPLFVAHVDLVDSKVNHAVQVADVLAGAMRAWVGNQAGVESLHAKNPLLDMDLMPLVMDSSIWPTGEIPTPTIRLNSNPADQMAAFARANRKP